MNIVSKTMFGPHFVEGITSQYSPLPLIVYALRVHTLTREVSGSPLSIDIMIFPALLWPLLFLRLPVLEADLYRHNFQFHVDFQQPFLCLRRTVFHFVTRSMIIHWVLLRQLLLFLHKRIKSNTKKCYHNKKISTYKLY